MNWKSRQGFLGKIKLDCKKMCFLSRVILCIVILHFLFYECWSRDTESTPSLSFQGSKGNLWSCYLEVTKHL